jgi:hypothetical protein
MGSTTTLCTLIKAFESDEPKTPVEVFRKRPLAGLLKVLFGKGVSPVETEELKEAMLSFSSATV